MMEVYNTVDWPPEKLLPYGPEITKALHQLRDRFPREVSIPHLFEEITSGKRQLWLIMDDDRFVSFVLTSIQIEPTGLKTLCIPSFAGGEGASTVHLIDRLEQWGRDNGCTEVSIFGRDGWTKPLAVQGYKRAVAVYRKAL